MDDADRLEALARKYRVGDRWAPVSAAVDRAFAADDDHARAARIVRARAVGAIRRVGVDVPPALAEAFARAFVDVPRERFVLPHDMAASALDQPLPLDPDSAATVSAPHAYLLTFALLDLAVGDRLLELGTGTGYGAALARHIVGVDGAVTSIEIDPALYARARRLVEGQVELVLGDGGALAGELSRARRATKIAFTYALPRDPEGALEALAPGGVLVAPVAAPRALAGAAPQEIVRFTRAPGGAVVRTAHGGVLYVPERRL